MFEEHYSLAKKNIEKEKYEQAKESLLKCLNLKPDTLFIQIEALKKNLRI